ncbi:LamG-like jellyroll fold domain-containing protein [Arthrobacter sp. YN]|uniref:LamG-like jellyroll fold domain-containing protein n=1 Tax=Arthrobacter sp. YN TaxID=2020486 RepID=UPI000B5F89C5|nr:LamG-like jellyroll fold domain-containing protein [Arthrobacter sp. YN]ASN19855.1 hypothetical protein CGK93_09355 [Arthrobacter sp. YN]
MEAKVSGEKIVVDSATTPTDLTVANPNGTFTRTMNTAPVRMETSAGWADISTDFVKTVEDGKTIIRPEQVPVDVTIGAGGSNEMAKIDDKEGHSIEQSWPFGMLPVPILVENTATYQQVLPGVDLVQIAHQGGVSQVLKIESAAAARDPRVVQMRLFLDADNATLSATPEGTITATGTESGEAELHMSGGQWWDSSQPGASALDPGTPGVTRPFKFTLGEEAGKQTQVFGMDEILNATDVTYPIYVDPPWNVPRTSYVMVDTAYPNTSYWNGAFSTETLNVGYLPPNWPTDGNAHLARSYYQFEGKTFDASADLINARFSVLETWSASCTPTGVASWLTGEVGTGTTWNNQPALGVRTDRGNVAKGWSSACPQGMVGFDLLAGESTLLNSAKWTIMLAADNELDTSGLAWKRFSNAGQVTVDYNRKPYGPAIHSVGEGRWAGAAWTSKYVTRDRTPTMAVFAGDIDLRPVNGTTGGPITVFFSVRPKAGGGNVFWGSVPNFSQEWGIATIQWGSSFGVLGDGDYILDAKGVDMFKAESPLMSFPFTVDTVGPAVPTVSPLSAELTSTTTPGEFKDLSRAPGDFTYKFRISNTYTSSRVPKASGFIYSVSETGSEAPPETVTCQTPPVKEFIVLCPSSDSVDINIGAVAPTSYLNVWAFDEAGNIATLEPYVAGAPKKITLKVASPTTATGTPMPLTPSGGATWVKINACGKAVESHRIPEGLCDSNNAPAVGYEAYALAFNGGKAETSGAAINPNESFSMAAWIRPDTASGNIQSVITQLAGTGPGAALEIGADGYGRLQTWYSATTSEHVNSDDYISAGEWSYVTAVYDKINRQLRLTANKDGLFGTWVVAASQPNVVSATTQKVILGQNAAGAQKFAGQIYRPILTNDVLTKAQFFAMEAAFKSASGTEAGVLVK